MAIKTIKGNNSGNNLTGTSGQDYIYGYGGNDTLSGGAGADTLDGGLGNDSLWGGAGNDVLLGGDGNDALSGDAGNDSLDGGAGTDTALFSGARSAYVVTAMNATTVQISGADGVKTVSNTELFNFGGTIVAIADLIPNLTAGGLSLSATSLAPNGALSVSLAVQASGSLAVPAIVSFELRNVATGQVTVVAQSDLGLMGGNAASVTSLDVAALGLAPGAYQIRGVLDRAGTVQESNESDNASLWADFSVQAPVVEVALAPLTLAAASDFDKNGDAHLTLDLTLTHSGNVGAGAHSIALNLVHDGQVISLGTVSVIVPVNGSASLSHTITIPAQYDAGSWQLQAELLPDASLPATAIVGGVQSTGFTLFGADDYGTSAAEVMAGSAVADVLHLAAGDDTMTASLGNDLAFGGDGADVADYSGFAAPLQISRIEATGQIFVEEVMGQGTEQTLDGFEKIVGTAGDDGFVLIDAPAGPGFVVDAGAGNDALIGTLGNDTLIGGAGDDIFDVLYGTDTIVLGAGHDLIALELRTCPADVPATSCQVLDFDVSEDQIVIGYFGIENQPATGLQFVSQTAAGALVDLGSGVWALLEGTSAASLTEANFQLWDMAAYQG